MKTHKESERHGTEGPARPPRTEIAAAPDADASADALQSWKEIAGFIGRDERTAMRWAKEKGMPVRRVPGGSRGRVYGMRSEISAWLAGAPRLPDPGVQTPPSARPSHSIPYLLLAALSVIAGIGLSVVLRPRNQNIPARVAFSSDSVQALSAEGGMLWTHRFSGSFDPTGVQGLTLSKLEERVRFADLRGDGNQEVIVVAPIRVSPNPEDRWHTEIDCFSGGNGKLLWSYTPREVLRFGDAEFHGPWDVSDVLVSRQTSKPSVWVAFNHYEWGNAFVEQIDPMTGLGTTRYVNSGTIHALNEMHTSHATYLLAGGFNNEHDGGSLAVIDESKPFAASPQTAGSRHQCVNCPQGVPDDYLVFPRSEISNVRKEYENSVRSISVNGDQFEVSQPEFPESSGVARSIYLFQFDSAIRPVSLRFSSTYEMVHRDFEASGTLLHSLAACPERLRPAPIRLWTPSEGWKELRVKPVQ